MLRILFGYIAIPASSLRMTALFINRLYHAPADAKNHILNKIEEGEDELTRKRTNGTVELDIPSLLGTRLVCYYTCCYFRWRKFKKWREAVEIGECFEQNPRLCATALTLSPRSKLFRSDKISAPVDELETRLILSE